MPKLGKRAKTGPEVRFFCHFLKFGSLVFFETTYGNSLKQCLTINGDKTHEKDLGSKNSFFCHFGMFPSLGFLDIAQDCSLGLCLTTSRAETLNTFADSTH